MASIVKTAGTVVSVGSWTSFDVATLNSSNDTRATTNATTYTSGVLRNFDFQIPAGKAIAGIEIAFEFSSSNSSATAYIKTRISVNAGANWSAYGTGRTRKATTDSTQLNGSSTDTWGLSLTSTNVNDNTNFYVEVAGYVDSGSRTCRLDYLTVTVYYAADLTLDLSDTVALNDSLSTSIGYNKSLDDTVSLNDNLSASIGFNKSLDDSVSLSDDLTKSSGFNRTLTDSVTIGDTISSELTAGTGRVLKIYGDKILKVNEVYTIEYGVIYNWYVASKNGGTGAGSIAPVGWHSATQPDWETLRTTVGGWAVAGAKLKETGYVHWASPNTAATNEYGFTARGGGVRSNITGIFQNMTGLCMFLTASEFGGLQYCYFAHYNTASCDYNNPYTYENQGGYIRCVKNTSDWTAGETVTDIDGRKYNTVKIGDQVWMAESLCVTRFNDGTPIPEITANVDWLAATSPALCSYDNDWANVGTLISPKRILTTFRVSPVPTPVHYGLLYNWYVASLNGGSGVGSVAALGFHVPTIYDTELLKTNAGGVFEAGGHLKEAGYDNWNAPNTGADNSTGFTAIGSGQRQSFGGFQDSRGIHFMWASDFYNEIYAYITLCQSNNAWWGSTFNQWFFNGHSIRLLKDSTTLSHGQTGLYYGNDGKIYPTICIFGQEWMSVNLAETKFNDGTTIPEVTNTDVWINLITPALCAYNNDWNYV